MSPEPRPQQTIPRSTLQWIATAVLEYLSDDTQCLERCSRVCAFLLGQCRPLMFRELRIRDPPPGHNKPQSRFVKFVRLLKESEALGLCLGGYIEDLHIEGTHAEWSPRPLFHPSLAAALLAMLYNLQRLTVLGVRLRGKAGELDALAQLIPKVPLLCPRKDLRELSLWSVGCMEDGFEDMLALFRLFKDVDRLAIQACHLPMLSESAERLKSTLPSALRTQNHFDLYAAFDGS